MRPYRPYVKDMIEEILAKEKRRQDSKRVFKRDRWANKQLRV